MKRAYKLGLYAFVVYVCLVFAEMILRPTGMASLAFFLAQLATTGVLAFASIWSFRYNRTFITGLLMAFWVYMTCNGTYNLIRAFGLFGF